MFSRNPLRCGLSAPVAMLGILGLTGICSSASAQVKAEESAKLLKPADGLEATLWASEPMVVNPTTMDIDSRGRVWITEGLNYRSTHGGGKGFPRHPDADKIKILEDTDGDGKADKVTVFADKIWPIPMGIAIEEHWSKDGKYQGCKVFVGNSPDLLVFEDTDGDDKADKRYPLLTGFGGVDSDHGVHGMALGMDGKLYFTHGDGCCSYEQDHSHRERNFDVTDKSGRHVWSDQLANTLRVDRDGKNFEIIADRQRNNYETCLNSFGNIFTSDNDDDGNRGSRVIWVMEGGKYGYRTPGSPRHWGEDVPGNVPKLVGTGNGSPCGVMVYEGDLLPKEYMGAVLEAEAGPRVVNFFPITRKGAAFRTEHKVMLASDDPWFRPVDVTAAPDGSVFVADWYDAGVGGHSFRDQTTGRIYRVAPKGAKTKKVAYDFGSVKGLIEALKSPVVSARDAARQILIARGEESVRPLEALLGAGSSEVQARAAWTLFGIQSHKASESLLHSNDARLRELAIRMSGRDVSLVGHVERPKADADGFLPGKSPLASFLALVNDPDAGVRRELILAFRDMPTKYVGAPLKKLASNWDGQDRWYLEALGLALKNREPEYLRSLFDGNLYGDLNLEESGKNGNVALPPYFPVDRNEAFISATDPEPPPANALSKTLGLAWMVHRAEVLPAVGKALPYLSAPELQQAADDVMTQITDPAGAVTLAEQAMAAKDASRRRQILATLGRKLDGGWRDAQSNPKVVAVIDAALNDPETRAQGIAMAGATGNGAYGDRLTTLATDLKAPVETRVAAVEAIARLKAPRANQVVEQLIGEAILKKSSNDAAEAAVRALPRLGDARGKLAEILNSADAPLGLRREALRTLATQGDGAQRLLAMAREKRIPDALKTEAATVLRGHPDGNIRNEALKVMPIASASGRPLPSNGELIRRDGKADRGREIFFKTGTTTCASCHRIQGRGQWVGPDLSTIGSKYGKDELLRSILNPSAAIGYNDRSLIVSLNDGQLLTGLMIEDTPDRLVIKTAEGKRIAIKPGDIEARKISELSLMPEGLAQAMQEQDLVDVLTYLATLRQPVSIIGQFGVIGPVSDSTEKPAIDPSSPVKSAGSKNLTIRRLNANAEGLADLVPIVGTDSGKAAYLLSPITSTSPQEARLVLDTKADVKAWLGGKPLDLAVSSDGEPRSVTILLQKGTSDLVIRLPGGNDANLVATFVTARPLEFSPGEAVKSESR
ncbi:MAG: putative rane-bound dehydrogenase [Planctomycetota bacterium]|nr:putative rane-bound dehydrogenase [Planctomycetota bacterium]